MTIDICSPIHNTGLAIPDVLASETYIKSFEEGLNSLEEIDPRYEYVTICQKDTNYLAWWCCQNWQEMCRTNEHRL